jgi:hypothetical protein
VIWDECVIQIKFGKKGEKGITLQRLNSNRVDIPSQRASVKRRFGTAISDKTPSSEAAPVLAPTVPADSPLAETKNTASKVNKKPSALYQWLHGMVKSTINVGIMLTSVVGVGYMYDQAVGDRHVPVFHLNANPETKSGLPQNLDALLDQNTISRFGPILSSKRIVPENGKLTAEEGYRLLQPSLSIVRQVVPEIADWYAKMQQEGRLIYGPHERAERAYGADVYAAYDQIRGTLHIGSAFWDMTELDKAANMVHEFRHARQNMPKVISDRLGQALTFRLLSDECRIEDEAYLYQEAFYRALGRPASFDVQAYLQSRGLMPQGKEKFTP